MTAPVDTSTYRDHVESVLRTEFVDRLRPIDEKLVDVLERYKDDSFGLSYLSLLLYCNGWNRSSYSNAHPQGLVFHDGDVVFGVGCFVTEAPRAGSSSSGGSPYGGIHLVAPRGASAQERVTRTAQVCRRRFSELPVYTRHLAPGAYESYLASGCWRPIDAAPWDAQAPSEDETFCHRRIHLPDLVDLGPEGYEVRVLDGGESRQFRRKAYLAHNRFRNFLRREKLRYRLVEHSAEYTDAAARVVHGHFDAISATRKVIGSSAADYENLVRFVPEPRDPRFFCRLGWLEGSGWRRPLSFFACEQLAEGSWGCYATISRRDPEVLPDTVGSQGFSAIAQYALLELFAELRRRGAREADLGGSETSELDRFKRHLGARHQPTYWAVYHGS
jgi:hypothetical protein